MTPDFDAQARELADTTGMALTQMEYASLIRVIADALRAAHNVGWNEAVDQVWSLVCRAQDAAKTGSPWGKRDLDLLEHAAGAIRALRKDEGK